MFHKITVTRISQLVTIFYVNHYHELPQNTNNLMQQDYKTIPTIYYN